MASVRYCTRVQAPDLSRDDSSSAAHAANMTRPAQTHSGGRLPMRGGMHSTFDVRDTLRVCTWNVCTLSQPGYPEALVSELDAFGIKVAALTESRLTDSGCLSIANYSIFYSGGDLHIHGVSLAVHHSVAKALMSWTPVSPRLLSARFRHKHGAITFIVAYAPTNLSADDEKDRFYSELGSLTEQVPPHDQLLLLGDFNAVTGEDEPDFHVLGGFGSGTRNENSLRFLSFASSYNLFVCGSFFRRKNIHRFTWLSRDGLTKKEIDHILTRDISSIKSCRVFRGPEAPAITDHLPLVAEVKAFPFRCALKKKHILHVSCLKSDTALAQQFNLAVANRFSALGDFPEDVETAWLLFRDNIIDVAKQTLPGQKPNRRPWLQPATLELLSQKKAARLSKNLPEVRRLHGRFRAKAKADLEAWYNDIANTVEVGVQRNDLRPAYRAIRKLRSGPVSKHSSLPMERLDGTKCSSPQESLARWAEHFSSSLNHPRATQCPDLDVFSAATPVASVTPDLECFSVSIAGSSVASDPPSIDLIESSPLGLETAVYADSPPSLSPISPLADPQQDELPLAPVLEPEVFCHPPTVDEVRTAIRKLAFGKAPGPDGIHPELLRIAEEPAVQYLHQLFTLIWDQRTVPEDWKDGVVIPVYKGKGSRSSCKSYRPITLLSVPGKVFAMLILGRLQPLLLAHRRPEQSGFTPSRSTSDAILALRTLAEIHQHFHKPLHVAYVDLKGAFDSVDRDQLWKILRSLGVPECFIELLKSLHSGTTARIRVDKDLSASFNTSSGVRQGCVLAPSLFCAVMDWVLRRLEPFVGITLAGKTLTDLLYADDAALFARDPSEWGTILRAFTQSASFVGMVPSWGKTKVQNVAHGPQPAHVQIGPDTVDSVPKFCYLGSDVDESGYCTPEVIRRIALGSSVMGQLRNVWMQRRLSLGTKLRLYSSCVLSVLLYGSETWTLRKRDMQRLESFHMSCQRRILGIRWFDFVRNSDICTRTKLSSISTTIARRRHSLFGHIRRLGDDTPAHIVLKLATDLASGFPPNPGWVRPRGRPRHSWLRQVSLAAGRSPQECWDIALERGEWQSRRPSAGPAS